MRWAARCAAWQATCAQSESTFSSAPPISGADAWYPWSVLLNPGKDCQLLSVTVRSLAAQDAEKPTSWHILAGFPTENMEKAPRIAMVVRVY